MKKQLLILFSLLICAASGVNAQAVWTEPATDINPDDTLTIFVDLTQTDCDKLVGDPGPLYIWTWMPNDPAVGNGDWSNSNPDLEMTNVDPDIWSFKMVPTEFYNTSASDVFDKDISFLVKAADGGSGGDCSAAGAEFKTEDLKVEVDPPTGGVLKVAPFPTGLTEDSVNVTQKDVFTLVYNNAVEDKATMQNPGDLWVYAQAWDTEGTLYRPTAITQVSTNPDLKMTKDGDIYRWMVQPERVFDIPTGKTLDYVQLQIFKTVVANSDDTVDGTFTYYFRCN